MLQVQREVGNKYWIYKVFIFHIYHKLSRAKLSIKITYTLMGLLGVIHPKYHLEAIMSLMCPI